ncbi:hypothetical protein [Hyphococcus luteus]|uniref:Uncharacterized protein n=1 Tax=Hyphococcus luteus TaxID=2058213 RepID=A0A2S7K5D3_9PROT|nr:hypothetical protein [Marinicaulis flavus]PQA87717.1 hypothetical protein CW354_04965 [Marinicaulis flavus]
METVFVAIAELSKSAQVVAFAGFGVCTSLKEFVKIGPGLFFVLQIADASLAGSHRDRRFAVCLPLRERRSHDVVSQI